jgi:hypothetical protein
VFYARAALLACGLGAVFATAGSCRAWRNAEGVMLIPAYCDTVPPRVTWRTPIAHVPAVAPPAAGRGALAGVVTERGSGRALSDAVVSLLSPDARLPLARSDSAGGFGAAGVAPGEYTLEVRGSGTVWMPDRCPYAAADSIRFE